MMHDGIKLYSEADTFEMTAGTLLSHLHATHEGEAKCLARIYRRSLQALFEYESRNCLNNHVDGDPGSIEQKRRNYTIRALRQLKKKFQKAAHADLERRRWKG